MNVKMFLSNLSRQTAFRFLSPHDQLIIKNLKLEPNDLFVDVGAFQGWYSECALKRGIKTVVFEANKETYKQLRKNLSKYNALILNKAVGDKNGEVSFFESSRPEVSSLNKNWFFEHSNTHTSTFKETRVEMVTLDSFFPTETIGMLKIDVEGFEKQVLKGASNLLKSGRVKNILTEWNYGDSEVFLPLLEDYQPFKVMKHGHLDLVSLSRHEIETMNLDAHYCSNILFVGKNFDTIRRRKTLIPEEWSLS